MSDKARLDYQHAAREEEQAKTSSLHLCEDVPSLLSLLAFCSPFLPGLRRVRCTCFFAQALLLSQLMGVHCYSKGQRGSHLLLFFAS